MWRRAVLVGLLALCAPSPTHAVAEAPSKENVAAGPNPQCLREAVVRVWLRHPAASTASGDCLVSDGVVDLRGRGDWFFCAWKSAEDEVLLFDSDQELFPETQEGYEQALAGFLRRPKSECDPEKVNLALGWTDDWPILPGSPNSFGGVKVTDVSQPLELPGGAGSDALEWFPGLLFGLPSVRQHRPAGC